jgi:hypothetical protein
MEYLKVIMPKKKFAPEKTPSWETTLSKLTELIIPLANPEYDKLIEFVNVWLIEFDEDGDAIREIGIDENENVILKMPYKENYGYWTDNELKYSDFEQRFKNENITGEWFENMWKKL